MEIAEMEFEAYAELCKKQEQKSFTYSGFSSGYRSLTWITQNYCLVLVPTAKK